MKVLLECDASSHRFSTWRAIALGKSRPANVTQISVEQFLIKNMEEE
jgi:hypothetical protein